MRRLNPFTAPVSQISGLNGARTRLQTVFFFLFFSRSCYTSTFNAMRFDENPFSCQCKNERQKGLKDFKFRTFIGRVQVVSWPGKG